MTTPIKGYRRLNAHELETVNANKQIEEHVLRAVDAVFEDPNADKRWAALARTHFEQGFMALNRAIMKPGRIRLPEDPQ